MALLNIESSGLSGLISINKQDFRDLKAPENTGFIIMNPPYGRRIKTSETDALYEIIGSTLKHNFPGYEALLITSDREALKRVGLKPAEKKVLFNGSIECLLVKYKMYPGSKKK